MPKSIEIKAWDLVALRYRSVKRFTRLYEGMSRPGLAKPPSGMGLSDLVSIRFLTKVFPVGVVDKVIVNSRHREIRQCFLSVRVVAYSVVGMASNVQGS